MAGEDWSGTALNLSMSVELANLARKGVEVKVILWVRGEGRFPLLRLNPPASQVIPVTETALA
jgi:hypothetical protein